MKLILCLFIILFSCSNQRDDKETLKKLIFQESLDSLSQNNPHLPLINKAFKKWNLYINFEVSHSRYQNGFKRNWIEISKNFSCDEEGLLTIRYRCQLGLKMVDGDLEGIVGTCGPQNYLDGTIHTTTIALNDVILNSIHYTDTYKINSIAHEIGHCLGLKHTEDPNNIMYPSLDPEREDYNFEQRVLLQKSFYSNQLNYGEAERYFLKSLVQNVFILHKTKPFFSVKVK